LGSSLGQQTDQGKQRALKNLFESYGHVFPLEVVLGGRVIQSSQGQVDENEDMEAIMYELGASLHAHIFGANVGGGNSQQRVSKGKKSSFHSSLRVHGGDATIQNPPNQDWIESVKDSKHILKVHIKLDGWLTYASYLDRNWRVVRVEAVIPIVDLLTDEEREEIARVAPPRPKALSGRWVDPKTQPLPGMFYFIALCWVLIFICIRWYVQRPEEIRRPRYRR
jgi:hypothetical protein